jgi:hypothetical protein
VRCHRYRVDHHDGYLDDNPRQHRGARDNGGTGDNRTDVDDNDLTDTGARGDKHKYEHEHGHDHRADRDLDPGESAE